MNDIKTASGLPWQLRPRDTRHAIAIAQQHGIEPLLAEILAARGVTPDTAVHFLNPTLRDYLPDPFHLLDMDKAAKRLAAALSAQQAVAVFGDYDVDGATSTTLLQRYFAALGIPILTYIPDRMTEGYGPTISGFDALITRGAQVIVTVDCGTLAHEPIAHANTKGVDVLVLDHHLSAGDLPKAYAVVNPNRVDETSPHRTLAAVGVTFLTLVALNKTLREQGYFASRAEPNLLSLLDCVALGTVCDVMPISGLNRALVAQGLKILAARSNLGLATLSDVARMEEAPGTYHLGFLLGPRINAGGRVGKSGLGVALLTTEDADEARAIAAQLDLHNQERQAIEAGVLEAATEAARAQQNMPVLLVAGNGWHPGVIGIVAGRLKELFQKPTAVIALEDGMGKASARSVSGADMGAAVHAAIAEGIIPSGGGHAMAAGFSVVEEKLQPLHQFLCARLGAAVAAYQESRVVMYDGYLSVAAGSLDTLDRIAQAGPFGLGNPSPKFVISNAQIIFRTAMKEKHLRLTLSDDTGAKLNAVAFNVIGTLAGEWLMAARSAHVLGELKRNSWQGRDSAQFIISDVAMG